MYIIIQNSICFITFYSSAVSNETSKIRRRRKKKPALSHQDEHISHLITKTNFRIRFLFHFVESLQCPGPREETVLLQYVTAVVVVCVNWKVCMPNGTAFRFVCQSHKSILLRGYENSNSFFFLCASLYTFLLWKWKVANRRAKQNVELDNGF